MSSVSVVIITRNEENNIVACIQSARQLTSDIIVVDCGSEDQTVKLAEGAGATTYQIAWQGFGYSRNFGAEKARNNWIFALDADERISPQLAATVRALPLDQPNQVYRFRRNNHLNGKKIRFGTLGYEKVSRIYNRLNCEWDLSLVHEKLVARRPIKKNRIAGHIDHFGLKSFEDYKAKSILYAQLSAAKYYQEGRKATFIKRFISPIFNSVKSYLFQFGFLEGLRGIGMAVMIARYSWLKYYYLHQHYRQKPVIQEEYHRALQTAETV